MDRKHYVLGLALLVFLLAVLYFTFGGSAGFAGTYWAVTLFYVGLALLVRSRLNDIGFDPRLAVGFILLCGLSWLLLIYVSNRTLFSLHYGLLQQVWAAISLLAPVFLAIAAAFPRSGSD